MIRSTILYVLVTILLLPVIVIGLLLNPKTWRISDGHES